MAQGGRLLNLIHGIAENGYRPANGEANGPHGGHLAAQVDNIGQAHTRNPVRKPTKAANNIARYTRMDCTGSCARLSEAQAGN